MLDLRIFVWRGRKNIFVDEALRSERAGKSEHGFGKRHPRVAKKQCALRGEQALERNVADGYRLQQISQQRIGGNRAKSCLAKQLGFAQLLWPGSGLLAERAIESRQE